MNKTVVAVVIVGIVLTALGVVLLNNNTNPWQNKPQSIQQAQQISQPPTQEGQMQEASIMLLTNGFAPASLSVKAGTKIVWINRSGKLATVNSDDHPTHKKFSELNLGQFGDGSSVQVVLTTPGTYTYHDHLNPTRTGTIIVEQ